MKKDFFKDSKIKFPAYEPWISADDKKIINQTLSQSMLTLGPQLEKFESDCCSSVKLYCCITFIINGIRY